ncbi:AAA domain (dynein-related subfamily) [Paraoerskovia marina]|uniref:AAA domain (Dynein-related subfamily) n=1 Tax=Paraoerskovia marina TaxID=545619 RepID=A0A1H1NV91_9CELL|nr:AAA family ATPase [Paraoerskovia marina]SDS02715.1 AAA domain (dynein-related subfamily) [Paraoerskovia marina]
MSATRIPYATAAPIYDVAARWRDRCLVQDYSLFSEGHTSTLGAGENLVRDFVDAPENEGATFVARVRDHLRQSSPEAVQLAGELLYIHFLIAQPGHVSGGKKREVIDAVLSISPTTESLPQDLGEILDGGLIDPGTAYATYRWRLFGFLVEFVVAVKRLSPVDRERALHDSAAFVELIDGLDDSQGGRVQKYALEHLLFPDEFAPVVGQTARTAITAQWSHLVAGRPSPWDLSEISQRLAAEAGEPTQYVDFWESPWHWQWSSPSAVWDSAGTWFVWLNANVDVSTSERQYKLAEAQSLADIRETLMTGGDWTQPLIRKLNATNLVPWRVVDDFAKWVTASPQEAENALRTLWQTDSHERLDAFADLVRSVLPTVGARLAVSSYLRLALDPNDQPPWRSRYVDDFFKSVRIHRPSPLAPDSEVYGQFLSLLDRVIDISARHGSTVNDRLDAQGLLWMIMNADDSIGSDTYDRLVLWRKDRATMPPTNDQGERSAASPHEEAEEIAGELTAKDVADQLFLDQSFIDDVLELLSDRSQVIFTGNPGTGKTFVAKKLALWIAGAAERVSLVQLHPSYSYEDFVEGYRPTSDGGFELRPGPLRVAADRAAADPSHTHVLVIDELNRGNTARVFGELYFLLEYRDESVKLMYSSQEFSLPKNLWIIGTMNSADRSIALLDSALRRRFSFVDFDPSAAPVSEVLPRFLRTHRPSMGWVSEVVHRANAIVNDPLAAIGPSHFMRVDLTERHVERIWTYDVLPTLRENLFGREDVLDSLSLEALRGQVQTEPSIEALDGDDE